MAESLAARILKAMRDIVSAGAEGYGYCPDHQPHCLDCARRRASRGIGSSEFVALEIGRLRRGRELDRDGALEILDSLIQRIASRPSVDGGAEHG